MIEEEETYRHMEEVVMVKVVGVGVICRCKEEEVKKREGVRTCKFMEAEVKEMVVVVVETYRHKEEVRVTVEEEIYKHME